MADRYTGRHIRQARHGAWVNKKRSRARASRHMLPAAAALTVAGALIGGAGAAIQLSAGTPADADQRADFDAADFPPPDRTVVAGRASRDDSRATDKPQTTAMRVVGAGVVRATGACVASYYDRPQETASGELADPASLTAAHQDLPMDSMVRVVNVTNGRSVIVRVNDRGPSVPGRCLDLSRAAFQEISSLGAGLVDVRYEVLVEDAT